MIVAERKHNIQIIDSMHLEDTMEDGRLTSPSNGKEFRLREAIAYSRKIGRLLTEEEMKQFEI